MNEHLFRRDGRLSELSLNRYLQGELSPDERSAVEGRLSAHPEERAALEAMRRFDGEHGLVPPVAKVLPFRRRAPLAVAGGLAVAAALALMMKPSEVPLPPAADTFRVKGATFELEVHVHDGERSRQVSPGDTVRAGDRVGFRVRGAQGGHLLIAGVDSTFEPYLCYPQGVPEASATSAPAPASHGALDAAVELDDTLGAETLVALLCDEPVTFVNVQEWLRTNASGGAVATAPPLRAGCVHRVFPLEKAR